jgi:hypothetical protein
MSPTYLVSIRTTCGNVQHQLQSQPSHGAERMTLAILHIRARFAAVASLRKCSQ